MLQSRTACFLAALTLVLMPPATASQIPQATGDNRWYWFGDCSDKKVMAVEVLLNGRTIHSSSFPACSRKSDYTKLAVPQKKIVSFTFKGGHVFQGQYVTKRTQTIEGNIWQAAADPHAVLLGVSFMTKNQVLLNTVHAAKVDTASTMKLDRGLVIRTFPLAVKASSQSAAAR